MDGTWTSVSTWDGMDTGMVEMGSFSDRIPADVAAEAKAMMDAIAAGEYHPFTGPINKQDGSTSKVSPAKSRNKGLRITKSRARHWCALLALR